MLEESTELINEIASSVQEQLNHAAGLGIKPTAASIVAVPEALFDVQRGSNI